MLYEFFFETTQIKKRNGVTLSLKPDADELLEWENNGKVGELEHSLILDISYGLFKHEIAKEYFEASNSVSVEFDYYPKTARASLLVEDKQLPLVEEICRILGFFNSKHHVRVFDDAN